jgi:hypothetical protein
MNIEIEGDSDAAVAFALLHMIAKGEGREEGAGREWVLNTFRECLAAVRDDMFTLEIDDEDDEDGDEDEVEDEGEEAAEAQTVAAEPAAEAAEVESKENQAAGEEAAEAQTPAAEPAAEKTA